ncbi:hypothetical protein [Palleronia caenipelagi]|uniref:Uncharacterized protein n=1 Tax=Palleronia caenipelagi TaxID=2489174 RepID=A0A547Q686_9RHOB|nr:hypothetical protein [Palleronia caenipelagi]TRD21905.1 hypothetical protein FEV53_07600 [Palleronia caenipelagi]
MFVKCLSTRHTAVGTFRFGVVYEIDPKDHKVHKAIKPLLEGDSPALEEVSKAAAGKARVTQFTPEASSPRRSRPAADLRGDVAKLEAALQDSQDKEAAATKRATELEAELNVAQDKEATATARSAELEAELNVAQDKEAAAAERLAELEAELTALKAAPTPAPASDGKAKA